MEEPIGPQILLLPTDRYWEWVASAREYALAYGASLTAVPQNAAQFHYPAQVIMIVVPDGDDEEQTRAIGWLRNEAPEARIDIVRVASPEKLAVLLGERLRSGTRYEKQRAIPSPFPSVPRGIQLQWPTDYPQIDQGFGMNSALYRRWGLPGHEGIDLRTTFNGRVYSCADGEVYLAHDGGGSHPYGVHVRIRHAGGWKTIYGHLNEAVVYAGQSVVAGELIGYADQTGVSVGQHVHLTLKKEGASTAGITPYPNDIVDPTPYLQFPSERRLIDPDLTSFRWPYSQCLVGLQSRLDEPMEASDWAIVRSARIQALRLTDRNSFADVDQALSIDPEMFVLVTLRVESGIRRLRPEDFAHAMENAVRGFYSHGVRYFEVTQDPNVSSFGFGTHWQSGREFAQWFLGVVGSLRGVAPEARFGWPGLAPGDDAGMRVDQQAFLKSAGSLVAQADWIGCHCYWENSETMFFRNAALNYQHYREEWPEKQLLITEFSNTSQGVSPGEKGAEYIRFYKHLLEEQGVGAAFASCVSAPSYYDHEVWRREDGSATGISSIIGDRNF